MGSDSWHASDARGVSHKMQLPWEEVMKTEPQCSRQKPWLVKRGRRYCARVSCSGLQLAVEGVW